MARKPPRPTGGNKPNSQSQEKQQKEALKASLIDQIKLAFDKLIRETLIFRLGVKAELFGNFAGEDPLSQLKEALIDEKKLEEKEKEKKDSEKKRPLKEEKVTIKLVKRHGEKNELPTRK
jgi:hypothetical protein